MTLTLGHMVPSSGELLAHFWSLLISEKDLADKCITILLIYPRCWEILASNGLEHEI